MDNVSTDAIEHPSNPSEMIQASILKPEPLTLRYTLYHELLRPKPLYSSRRLEHSYTPSRSQDANSRQPSLGFRV